MLFQVRITFAYFPPESDRMIVVTQLLAHYVWTYFYFPVTDFRNAALLQVVML